MSAWDKNLNTGGAVDPCILLARDGLQCYRNRRAGLALVRQLDRPALLTLVTAEGKNPVTVLLRGLNDQTAFLEGANGSRLAVGVSELATLWRGEFVTLRRAPQELADDGDFATNAAAGAWLDTQLAKALGATAIGGDGPDSRRARIRQFQQTQGITPDGLAGSMTLMLLNRAAGVNEPRLRTGA